MNELKPLIAKLNILIKTDKAEKRVITSMLTAIKFRIFTDGKDATGSQIGKYSDGYMKQRQKKNYTSSNKVILQATKSMIGDWSIVSEGNKIGLGFKNSENTKKSFWVEETYSKEIFDQTKDEDDKLALLWDEEVRRILK